MKIRGLTATELKLIAVVAMVIDHVAWACLDFGTPLAQVMHIIGRITIPIMCYFVAEGYRHTTNMSRYVCRLAGFGVISIVPYYLFFHDVFGYRQNILFDLLFGLLALIILNKKDLTRPGKVIGLFLVAMVSWLVGGWPILPAVFVIIFYYTKNHFGKMTFWVILATVLTEAATILLLYLNLLPHVLPGKLWYERMYLLAFVLALPFIRLYNGKRGCTRKMAWGFYIFYPVHLTLLLLINGINGIDLHLLFVMIHILGIIFIIVLLSLVAFTKTTEAQVSSITFLIFVLTFMFAFLIEITSENLDVIIAAIKIEYLGICGFLVGVTWFTSCFVRIHMPKWVYMLEIGLGMLIMLMLMTVPSNQIFYKELSLKTVGNFKMVLVTPGLGYIFFYGYFTCTFLCIFYACLKRYRKSGGVERKRIFLILMSFSCPWVAIILKILGLSGGYDLISVGICGALLFVAIAYIRYGYFNSIQAATTNALNHGNEGVLVIDMNYEILFINDMMKKLFPEAQRGGVKEALPEIERVVNGEITTFERNHLLYEIRLEPLVENGYIQGYMLWLIDMTKHYARLKRMQTLAEKDGLTGLYNRSSFQQRLNKMLKENEVGAMVMIDMDNFKQINDNYGHGVGDRTLQALSEVICEELGKLDFPCRLGGDEFCMFLSGRVNESELKSYAKRIQGKFAERQEKFGLEIIATISIGIAITNSKEKNTFETLYEQADKALYLSKKSGKNTYCFYEN